MSHDSTGIWVEKAKSLIDHHQETAAKMSGRKKPVPKTSGNTIMEVADKLRPWLTQMFENIRDENGMLVQQARIRALALNVAQTIVQRQKKKA
jgi:hypothetical protein